MPGLSETGKLLFNRATLKVYDRPTLRAVIQAIHDMDLAAHEGQDLKGDMYEYLLSKISMSGTNGQFRSRAKTTELVGATAYVLETPPNLLLPDKLWRFFWKQPVQVEPFYVWSFFQTATVRRELGRRATGTSGSMKNISKPKVLSMLVPTPPLLLQRQFAARVQEIRALEGRQAESRCRLDDLFQSLLHRAFQGEL